MANQRADHLAVRTGGVLEPLTNRGPFLFATIKPSLLAHALTCLAENRILLPKGRCGVVAGYDKDESSGCGVARERRFLCQILGVKNILELDGNSATFAPKCDQSEVKDS